MAAAPDAKTIATLRTLLDRVPAGHVTTHRAVAETLKTTGPHVMQLVAALAQRPSSAESALPWWRIVADGGAIGRLAHRDKQIASLAAEGVLVSPVGIVQGLTNRRATAEAPAIPAMASSAASRARGSKGKPASTV